MPDNASHQNDPIEFWGTAAEEATESTTGKDLESDLQDLLYRFIRSEEGEDLSSKESWAHEDNKATVIDLQALFYHLIDKWFFILSIALIFAVIVTIAVFFVIPPQYAATSKLYILSPNDSAVNLSDLQIGTYLTSDYQEVFKTWEVHQQVIDNLALSNSYEELQAMLTIENPSDTRILRITFHSGDPQEAKDVANEYANVAKQYIGVTMKTEEPMIMSQALKPLKPESPKKAQDIFLGFLLGGLIAAGIVAVGFILDDKVKMAQEIQKYGGMATLAVVPATENEAIGRRGELR